jgi:hypothetical protein
MNNFYVSLIICLIIIFYIIISKHVLKTKKAKTIASLIKDISQHPLYNGEDLSNYTIDYLLNYHLRLQLLEKKQKFIIQEVGEERAKLILRNEVPLGITIKEFYLHLYYMKKINKNRNLNFQKITEEKTDFDSKTIFRNWNTYTTATDKREYIFVNDSLEEINKY